MDPREYIAVWIVLAFVLFTMSGFDVTYRSTHRQLEERCAELERHAADLERRLDEVNGRCRR